MPALLSAVQAQFAPVALWWLPVVNLKVPLLQYRNGGRAGHAQDSIPQMALPWKPVPQKWFAPAVAPVYWVLRWLQWAEPAGWLAAAALLPPLRCWLQELQLPLCCYLRQA